MPKGKPKHTGPKGMLPINPAGALMQGSVALKGDRRHVHGTWSFGSSTASSGWDVAHQCGWG